MKKEPSLNAIRKHQQDKLAKLGLCGPFVAGSLNSVVKKDKQGRASVYYLLTFKEEGKTRSVYVPKDLAEEVRGWVQNYHKLKKSIARVSADSIAAIRGHVREKRAEDAKSRKKKGP